MASVIADLATGEVIPDLLKLHTQAVRLVSQRGVKYRTDAERSVTCRLDDAPPSAFAVRTDEADDATAIEPTRGPGAVASKVRELADKDPPVLELLELYERGLTRRRDVLESGMSPSVYRTARERLTVYGQRALAVLARVATHDDVEATRDDRSSSSRCRCGHGHRQSRVARNALHQASTGVKQRSA